MQFLKTFFYTVCALKHGDNSSSTESTECPKQADLLKSCDGFGVVVDRGASCCNSFADFTTTESGSVTFFALTVTCMLLVVLGATLGGTLPRLLSNHTAP